MKTLLILINRPITSGKTFSRQQQKHEQNYQACKELMHDPDQGDPVDSLVGHCG